MSVFQIALIQMHSTFGQREENLSKAEEMIRQAAAHGAKLICLPETFNTGHFGDMDAFLSMAEPLSGPATQRMRALARELEVVLLSPILVLTPDGSRENTAIIIGSDGQIIGTYAKTHPVGDERATLVRGSSYPVFNTPLGRIGICICYDACFPETTRMLALHGAQLILVPAAWRASHYFTHWWDTVLPCRALDNLCYLAAVNQVGSTGSGEELYAGKSQIINPTGVRIATLGADQEDILYQLIDLDHVEREREFNSMLSDRHPEDYHGVASAWTTA